MPSWAAAYSEACVLAIDINTGDMTAITDFADRVFFPHNVNIVAGTRFAGAVYLNSYVYLIPFNNKYTHIARIDPRTLTVTAIRPVGGWPVDMDPAIGQANFYGGVSDGRNIWMVPHGPATTQIGKFDTVTNIMTAIHNWPKQYDNATDWKFQGGAFDGQYVYLAPGYQSFFVRFQKDTNEMEYLGDTAGVHYSGAAFDGASVWYAPREASITRVGPGMLDFTDMPHDDAVSYFLSHTISQSLSLRVLVYIVDQ